MAPNAPQIEVHLINSETDLQQAFAIRKQVFVAEQGVPEEEELDEFEAASRHFLVTVNDEPAGTARWRVTPQGKIKLERFAVLASMRGYGLGRELVLAVLADVPPGAKVYLHAQVQVIGFYEKLGFQAEGPEFDECGIMHRVMTR